ncbi:hypothetical protein F3Y22_tig00110328pilonHSYRG01025 [Hibiscus syriacus]|uniref:Reverse transcriptase domain-containing protein n=1 Tax=Hibiscus syriacus TaxID=106335 RepID=A0A6A3AZ58_HIBSY|nr:hypothetical protein F3Y22_tig00110328pilonHSYRG01025 [Hibiscus syriacus]
MEETKNSEKKIPENQEEAKNKEQEPNSDVIIKDNESSAGNFGPWMFVQRRKKGYKGNTRYQRYDQQGNQSENRFESLTNMDTEVINPNPGKVQNEQMEEGTSKQTFNSIEAETSIEEALRKKGKNALTHSQATELQRKSHLQKKGKTMKASWEKRKDSLAEAVNEAGNAIKNLFKQKEVQELDGANDKFMSKVTDLEASDLINPITMEEIRKALFSMKSLKAPGPDVLHFRPILQRTESPYQNNFLAGRSTTDNILVVQEAVHNLMNLPGRKGAVILKTDLQETYDKSGTIKPLWYGEKTESFDSGQGLRQGDPLSPYFFILVMERLSHVILELDENKRRKAIKLSMRGHLNELCEIPLTSDLGVYLGVPIIHKRISASTYNPLIDKIIKKLASWKGKVLSMEG